MLVPDISSWSFGSPASVRLARRSRPLTLAAVLIMTGIGTAGIWLGQAAIAPEVAQAYTSRVDVSVDNLPGESFETLMRRAESVARAAAQRSFDRDILVTNVSVIVTAQNEGATAPLFTLEVSRPQWRSFPDPRRWATYYRSARFLLGFEKSAPTATSPAPTATPSVQVTPNPANAAPSTTPAGTTPGTIPGATPASAPPGTAPANATPSTTPAGTPPTTPGTPPANAPAPPTTPGTPGSTPAPGAP